MHFDLYKPTVNLVKSKSFVIISPRDLTDKIIFLTSQLIIGLPMLRKNKLSIIFILAEFFLFFFFKNTKTPKCNIFQAKRCCNKIIFFVYIFFANFLTSNFLCLLLTLRKCFWGRKSPKNIDGKKCKTFWPFKKILFSFGHLRVLECSLYFVIICRIRKTKLVFPNLLEKS